MVPASSPAEVEARPIGRAAAWLAALGIVFFTSYGFANWLASLRTQVPVVVFDWERGIPFWAWSIVPYWSIDLLYCVSVLVCRTQRELDTQVRRLLTAQALSIACFIVFPLRFSFERPATDGLLGALFTALGAFDKPFNQAPSLHISLLVVIYARLLAHAAHPLTRLLLHAWMPLIGVSVLTTYQHHFIDLPTGLLAGFICLWLWPESARSPLADWRLTADPQRARLAVAYLAGMLACAALATGLGGAWLWLWWPGASLLLVSLIYAGFGPEGFQKDERGQLSLAARVLLAPYLAGAWSNSRAWTLRQPRAHHVAGDVWLGRMPTNAEIRRGPYRAMVDLSAELSAPTRIQAYSVHPVLDLTVASAPRLLQAAHAIERQRAAGPVLVCCALGYSRSASAVASWLLHSGRAHDADAAAEAIRSARPGIVLAAAHVRAIAGAKA